MRNHTWKLSVFASLLALGSLASSVWAVDVSSGAEWVEGTLLIAWGTPGSVVDEASPMAVALRRDDGTTLPLDFDEDLLAAVGGPMKAGGRRVRVLIPSDGIKTVGGSPRPLAINAIGGTSTDPKRASGSYPYISIMCQFLNNTDDLESVSYFQGMYANVWPGLDHYWRRQSYDMVDVVGSTAAGWFMLPHTQQHYVDLIDGSNHTPMLYALYNDCTSAASSVNPTSYDGINMMFNDTFGQYAWGGWGGVTWEPPWGWKKIAIICHEMGHAFGLPHSNNADGDSSPYDNPWDVMSDAHGYAVWDSTYGSTGKHTISYHKDSLGWISAARKAVVSTAGLYEFDIDHLTLASTDNLHMVKVMIPGSTSFYTAEVRDRVSYDGNLPGFAVVIHQVAPSREEPAWLVDGDAVLTNGGDAGAMWLPGECFEDPANEISICVESVTTEGYTVRVAYGNWGIIFEDDFEAGNTGAWSSVGN